MSWTIRDARPDDWPVIVDFNLRMALETEHKKLDPARVTPGVRRVLADPALGRYFVAEHEGRIIGQLMITLEWSDWRNGMFWWLQSVFVDETWRGQGVFRGLYEHVERLARAEPSVCGIRLYMDEGNARAQRAYAALGIGTTGYLVLEKDLPADPADGR
jgi:GNAT superfamily N-acetyltransferase